MGKNQPTPRDAVLAVLAQRPQGYETKEVYYRHRGGFTRSTITRALNALEKEGLVKRRSFYSRAAWWHLVKPKEE